MPSRKDKDADACDSMFRTRLNIMFLRPQVLLGIIFVLCVVILYNVLGIGTEIHVDRICPHKMYNATYPLTQPHRDADMNLVYKIAVITDMDHDSAIKDEKTGKVKKWKSHFLRGELRWNPANKQASVDWEPSAIDITTTLNAKGRGMELSELVVYNGRLLTVDDRTGVVYEILHPHSAKPVAVPWIVLGNGDGLQAEGLKAEWMAVQNDYLYVGGLGKVWTTETGEFVNHFPQWVKRIDTSGHVEHVDWTRNYDAMRHEAKCDGEGYVIHESAMWSALNDAWFFLPRRASPLKYDDVADEQRGTNMIISTDAKFNNVRIRYIGNDGKRVGEPTTHGFSATRFLPGTAEQVIIALKSEEFKGQVGSYIVVLDTNGNLLMPEQKLPANYKYEGIEFI